MRRPAERPEPLRLAVIDHGAGNLVSIGQALAAVGGRVVPARRVADLAAVDGLVLPGVGAAGPAMERLRRRDLVAPIRDWVAADRPFLGICLGLQLLFDGSDEDGATCLGLLPGRSVQLVGAPRLPHIGWNQVRLRRPHPAFAGLTVDPSFYFVHSFAVEPASAAAGIVLADTEHGRPFASVVARGHLVGVQFHPERSADDGLRVLAGFLRLVATAARAGRPRTEAARPFRSVAPPC